MPEFIPEHTPRNVDDFTRGYLEAVEWLLRETQPYENGNEIEIDRDSITGWDQDTLKTIIETCADFQQANAAELETYQEVTSRDLSSAGTDFYLTRNRHGAGFWDRGNHPVLEALTDAAHAYGGTYDYVDETGLIHSH